MKIINARKKDAPAIAHAIVLAVGEEVCKGLAGETHTVEDVENMFAGLASREDTQYSYLNTLVAVNDDDETIGVCVGYDGARLQELREVFFEAVSRELGLNLKNMGDETDSDEFYIDTLAVFSGYRGQGIASRLLDGMIRRAGEIGKPAGLLVEKENHNARRLYEETGFRQVGERPFCYIMMDHLQHKG
ncbi:MAG: GNAT family N-acetyltransferase [Bacteroides sp.]|nr:GNAT family N-acetyltransferase [Bacteroides sp.]